MSRQIIWTTQSVNEAADKLSQGFVLGRLDNPFFEGIVGLRKEKIAFKMSSQEREEYIKCALEPKYFAEKCYVKGDDGSPILLKLRDYQKDILDNFFNHRFNILMSARQSGKTICSSIAILHFVLFNNSKNVLVTANILATAVEVLDKIKEIYQRLPFFLQQGVVNWNQKFMVFENKSRIKGFATTKTSSIGQTADFLYLDEFAHLPDNIAGKFYKSVFPTVSNIDNSKIIITSTPNGKNLFHKLLTDAEKPEGEKSSYVAKRVYWWQVPKRLVTYIRLDPKKIDELQINPLDLESYLKSKYPHNEVKLYFNESLKKWVINVFNTHDGCSEEDILRERFLDWSILEFTEVTTWKKETIKDIGSEEAFNQEYDLRFLDSSRSLLDEAIIEDLSRKVKDYKWEQIDEIESKIKFSYKDLKWTSDEMAFNRLQRKQMKIIMSVDISEGLGQDFSVINIFKVGPKEKELIESQKESYKNIVDFFKLQQIGIYRSNFISVQQLSELIYLICFEYFNPDNVKVVLEINTYGNELLAHLPNVLDGNSNYGSYIFFRYRHRADADEEKIGIKIGDNKNILVKEYQDRMQSKSIDVTNDININEITTFIKHITPSGNVRYYADGSSNDDTVMTLVSVSSIFGKMEFKQMVEDCFDSMPDQEMKKFISESLDLKDVPTDSINYSQFLKIRNEKILQNKSHNQAIKSTNAWMGNRNRY